MIKPGSPAIDVAAVALSAGCLAHCLLLPVAASLLPLLGAAEEAEWAHWAFVALAIPASALALRRPGARAALVAGLRVLAVAGVGLLLAGAAGWPNPAWETPLTVAGALVLAGAHIVNGLTRHSHSGAS